MGTFPYSIKNALRADGCTLARKVNYRRSDRARCENVPRHILFYKNGLTNYGNRLNILSTYLKGR